jgi:hypothetical protein
MCIQDDEGRFVLAKPEWLSPLLDVDLREALGLLSALHWVRGLGLVRDMRLGIVNFELDSKILVDSIYGGKSDVSNYSTMINDRRFLLAFDLVISDVRFVRRQANKVAHSCGMLVSIFICYVSSF